MSSKNAYRLVNPHIEGSLETVVRAKNSFSAGKKLYNSISNFFTNHVDNFYMTIQNVETKDLTHFKINEKRDSEGNVDFKLIKIDESFDPETNKKIISTIEKVDAQSGGKHRHKHKHHRDRDQDSSSSSSSSSSEDYFRIPIQPISRFVYFSLPYYKLQLNGLTPIDVSRLFMPMFSLPINPSLEIRFDLYKM